MPRLFYFVKIQPSCHREERMLLFLTVLSRIDTLTETHREGTMLMIDRGVFVDNAILGNDQRRVCRLLFFKSQVYRQQLRGSSAVFCSVCFSMFLSLFLFLSPPLLFLSPPHLLPYILGRRKDIKGVWYPFCHQPLWGFGNVCCQKDYRCNNMTLSPKIQAGISLLPFIQHCLDGEHPPSRLAGSSASVLLVASPPRVMLRLQGHRCCRATVVASSSPVLCPFVHGPLRSRGSATTPLVLQERLTMWTSEHQIWPS